MNPEAFSIFEPYYLIVDLEATCSKNMVLFPREEMEIIEIGAVLLEATSLEIVSSFETFVRPVRHPKLTPFCTELTTITQAQVDGAPGYKEALNRFQNWFRPFGPSHFCSWGEYDRHQFQRDCQRHHVGYPFLSKHLNLKTAYSEALGLSRKFGMAEAMQRINLPLEGTLHRGIDDARNMARIVQTLLGKTSAAS